MSVSYGAVGTGVGHTNTVAIGHVASIGAGDLLLIYAFSGDSANSTPGTPAGWTLLATAASTEGTWGNQTGPRRVTIFYKIATGSESGTVTVAIPATANSLIWARMERWDKTLSTWVIDAYSDDYQTSQGTFSSLIYPGAVIANGDQFALATASPDASTAISGQAFAATGITFGAVTENGDSGQTNGNDLRLVMTRVGVTAGSGTQTVTYTQTQDVPLVGVLIHLRDSAGGTDYDETPADDVDITDSTSVAIARAVAPADPVGITDAATSAVDRPRSAADNVGVTDSATAAVSRAASAADGVGVTDAVEAVRGRSGAPSDAVGITDATVVAIQRNRSATDAVGVSDSAAPSVQRNRAATDAVGITDSVTVAIQRAVTIADPVGITDGLTVEAAGDKVAGASDPVGIVDSATPAVSRARSAADTVGLSDATTVAVGRAATTSDPVSLTDEVVVAIARGITIDDQVGISDAIELDAPDPPWEPGGEHRLVSVRDRHKLVDARDRHALVAVAERHRIVRIGRDEWRRQTVRTIESATSERKEVVIETAADPTDTPPLFQATSGGRNSPDPDEWVEGSWDGDWSAANRYATALTPLMGADADLVIEQGEVVDVWMTWTAGADDPVIRVGTWRGL